MSDTPSMFHPGADATPVSEIKRPTPDPRAAGAHRMHKRITQGVRDGSIYREPRRSR